MGHVRSFSRKSFRITWKPVVHTRLCMVFNYLKQSLNYILLSKSYDMSKSIVGVLPEDFLNASVCAPLLLLSILLSMGNGDDAER